MATAKRTRKKKGSTEGSRGLPASVLQADPHAAEIEPLTEAIEADGDAIASDFQFHHEIARATHNPHFAELMTYLGTMIIPRARVNTASAAHEQRRDYLRRVSGEHESILNAIAARDAEAARAAMRTHLANSRERLRRSAAAQDGAL